MEGWSHKLALVIGGTLDGAACIFDDKIEVLAVDCHPWNGLIILAALTRTEAIETPFLLDPAEIAAWKHYNFASEFSAWAPARILGSEMRKSYDESVNRKQKAEQFLVACANALSSPQVQTSVGRLPRSNTFRCTVPHPDSGKEFYVR